MAEDELLVRPTLRLGYCVCDVRVKDADDSRLRPAEFVKKPAYEDSDDEESTVGKMPPSDSDEE